MSEPTPVTGGWRELQTISRWNSEQAEEERTTDPIACPQHGDPLDERDGRLHCPMGHFVQRA